MNIGKRGVSHIELITAILIFIFAIVTVVYFINAQKGIETSRAIIDALESDLRDKTEVNIEKVSLFVQGTSAECFNLSLYSDLDQENLAFIPNTKFNFSDNWLLLENIDKNFYEIYYFSEEIVENTENNRLDAVQCMDLNEGDYNYSINYRGKIFSEKKLKDLILDYKDYQIVVKDLNIFIGKVPPKQVEVQAKDISAEIVKENGEIVETKINIKVW